MNKYQRTIKGATLDVYDILLAWNVTDPGIQHAIKKLLMPGQRGSKGFKQDVKEAIAACQRTVEMAEQAEVDIANHTLPLPPPKPVVNPFFDNPFVLSPATPSQQKLAEQVARIRDQKARMAVRETASVTQKKSESDVLTCMPVDAVSKIAIPTEQQIADAMVKAVDNHMIKS